MTTIRFKTLALGVLVSFVSGCLSTRNISPQEIPLVAEKGQVVLTLKDKSVVKMSHPVIVDNKIIRETGESPGQEIEIAQVRSVSLTRKNYLYPVIFGGALVVAAILMNGAATAPSPPPSTCCPFIYAFDGRNWVFEAEPYGGALCQAMERVEWCRLDQIREDRGLYRILVANELEETQYTDEFKLLAVDHPAGLTAAFDPAGHVHTFADPLPPLRAYDAGGRDLLSLVRQSDDEFWQSPPEDGSLTQGGDPRDEIVLEFPKPQGVRTAKLLANVWTSARGSAAAKSFLELYGKSLPGFYAEVNRFGPAYHRLSAWFFKEELYLLKVLVETRDGWKAKGLLYGGGPFIAKEKAYAVDVSDVAGDVLRLKLRPPKGFWLINSLAVDYSEDAPVKTWELSAQPQELPSGGGPDTDLAADDNRYLVLQQKGDHAELAFAVPARAEGAGRTVFIKARGYYDIHLDTSGEPRWDLIARIYDEPGFCVRFAEERFRRELARAGRGRDLSAK